jgi:hypothetical protein
MWTHLNIKNRKGLDLVISVKIDLHISNSQAEWVLQWVVKWVTLHISLRGTNWNYRQAMFAKDVGMEVTSLKIVRLMLIQHMIPTKEKESLSLSSGEEI